MKGYRLRQYDLVAPLFDARAFSDDDLAALYFRHIKTTMGLDQMHYTTPEMVHTEMAMFSIAYNLLRAITQEAAELYQRDLDRPSFKASVDTLRQVRSCFAAARSQPLVQCASSTRCFWSAPEHL